MSRKCLTLRGWRSQTTWPTWIIGFSGKVDRYLLFSTHCYLLWPVVWSHMAPKMLVNGTKAQFAHEGCEIWMSFSVLKRGGSWEAPFLLKGCHWKDSYHPGLLPWCPFPHLHELLWDKMMRYCCVMLMLPPQPPDFGDFVFQRRYKNCSHSPIRYCLRYRLSY